MRCFMANRLKIQDEVGREFEISSDTVYSRNISADIRRLETEARSRPRRTDGEHNGTLTRYTSAMLHIDVLYRTATGGLGHDRAS